MTVSTPTAATTVADVPTPAPAAPVITPEQALTNSVQAELKSVKSMVVGRYGENHVSVQDIRMYPTHIEVEVKGIKKAISLLDFKTILDEQLQMDTRMDALGMPYHTFVFAKSAGEIQLSCYYPGRKVTVKHQNMNIKSHTIPFPNIIISHKLVLEDGFWLAKRTSYMCTDKAVTQLPDNEVMFEPNPGRGTYLMPFPNFYGDGRMCYGNNTMQYKFTHNLRGLDYYYQILTLAPFNNDLGIQGVKREIASTPAGWFAHLEKLETFNFADLSSYKG